MNTSVTYSVHSRNSQNTPKEPLYPTIYVRNSFCYVKKFPQALVEQIQKLLTYVDEEVQKEISALWGQSNWAARQGKTKMVYAIRAKIDYLKQKEVVCWFRDGAFPTGHLHIVQDFLKAIRYNDYKVEDERETPKNFVTLRWRNVPHQPRYYQTDMINLGITETRGVFESAVGTGKTLILTYLIKQLGVNSLVIVPSAPLLEQTYRGLCDAFGKKNVETIKTAKIKNRKKKGFAPIRLVVIDTLVSLKKQGLLQTLIQDIDLIAVDEIHHAGSDSYTQLLPDFDHIFYRFGFTGTFLRNDSKTLDMWGFLSNRLYHYPPFKAIQDGYLTPVELVVEDLEGEAHDAWPNEYRANYCGGRPLLAAILRRIKAIPNDEQILILVKQKDAAGKVIHEFLKAAGIDNSYISGDDKRDYIVDCIEEFNEKKIRVLVGSTVIGEGVDIHSTKHLILANGGKSPIQLVQAIGRCVRLHPGKEKSFVYDFNFVGTNYQAKHCTQRSEIFENYFSGEIKWIGAANG